MQNRTVIIALGVIVLLCGVYWLSTSSPQGGQSKEEKYPIVKKEEGWGPCISDQKCSRTLFVYNDGSYVIESGTSEFGQMDNTTFLELKRAVQKIDLKKLRCKSPSPLADYWYSHTFYVDEKEYVFSLDQREDNLQEIYILLPSPRAQPQGGA